jgi:hypothetical protein
MHWTTLAQDFFSTATPLMPNADLLMFGLIVSWAMVLGALGAWLSRSWPRPYRLALVVGLMLLTLMPGSWSPDYWLGLAFQVPSFVTVLICMYWIVDLLVSRHDRHRWLVLLPSQIRALHWLAWGGIVLGWLLLLDTLSLLPFPIYNYGFSVAGLTTVGLLAVLPWIFRPRSPGARLVTLISLLLLTLYAVTRLPDGNLWDALMDPVLWLALQWIWLGHIARSLISKWRASRATRA